MIPSDRLDVLDAGLAALGDFGRRTRARGRLIALYLGLRRMGDGLAPLGSASSTSIREIEEFMDELLRKRHRAEPFVVLTAPFSGSTSRTAPYSTRTDEIAPGHRSSTNTWRNNINIQKGIGCPADPKTIRELLADPGLRRACPHMDVAADGKRRCTLEGATYRGEEHSIWLRKTGDGCQKVDLDDPATYEMYLMPGGERIPLYALIAALYCDAPDDAYPRRELVGIADFAADFGFSADRVESLFECDPGYPGNGPVVAASKGEVAVSSPVLAPPAPAPVGRRRQRTGTAGRDPVPLPEASGPVLANSGLGAELAVAADLIGQGWEVAYRGSQAGVGYDLEASRGKARLCVEVKSSVAFTTPELSESEWAAAREHGGRFVLAIVDFYGSSEQSIRYVRDPAATAKPSRRTTTVYRLPRAALEGPSTDAELLSMPARGRRR